MLGYFKYRRDLNRLFKNRRDSGEYYLKKLAEVGENNDSDKIRELGVLACHESDEIEEHIRILVTNYLRERATKLFVPLPDNNDTEMWGKCSYGGMILTDKGVCTLRAAIRKEMKESTEVVSLLLASLTGVLGTIIGLISLF